MCLYISSQLPNIFSAGNPEHFHKNYLIVMEFITKLEHHVISIEQFQHTELYLNFIQKWNLPVYYQIRFQEIGKSLLTFAKKSPTKNNHKTSNMRQYVQPLSLRYAYII